MPENVQEFNGGPELSVGLRASCTGALCHGQEVGAMAAPEEEAP